MSFEWLNFDLIAGFLTGLLAAGMATVYLFLENSRIKQKNIEFRVALDEQQKHHQDKLSFYTQAQRQLSDAFKALSSEALRNNNQSFLELATAKLERFQEGARTDLTVRQKAIDDLLKPIKESLDKVDSTHQELKKSVYTTHTSLTEQIKGLSSANDSLKLETNKLVKALRAPHVRGRWGELQLRRVVEMAGMVEHCDFVEQPSVTHDERRLRPDLIIKLPNNKQVVVDSKTALNAYLEAIEAQDDETRIARLKDHAKQIRTHINQLSTKAYWDQFDSAPEFVVLFIPGEPFYSAALEQDPDLIEFGVDQKVIIATPTTLIAVLRAVAYGWQQEAMAENARKICDAGIDLYSRIAVFTDHFRDLRKHIEKSVEAYNQALGSFESRLLVTARDLKKYKVATSEEIKAIEPIEKPLRSLADTLT
jgi:DNA recombination protein RmuC